MRSANSSSGGCRTPVSLFCAGVASSICILALLSAVSGGGLSFSAAGVACPAAASAPGVLDRHAAAAHAPRAEAARNAAAPGPLLQPPPAVAPAPHLFSFLDIVVSHGGALRNITLLLFPRAAPVTVAHLQSLSRSGFFDGDCAFYRAENGFCLQGGCQPYGKMGAKIPLEYNVPNFMKMVSMARQEEPDTATQEISIMLKDNSKWLGPGGSNADGYAVFGRVVAGWDLVLQLARLPFTKGGSMRKLISPVYFEAIVPRTGTLDWETMEEVGRFLRWT